MPPTTGATPTTRAPLAGAGLDTQTNFADPGRPSAPNAGYSPISAVRAAHQPGFDRVVFEFSGALPGYRVMYGPPSANAISDRVVTVEGAAGLSVTIYMGGRWFVEPPPNVPRELRGDTVGVSNVKEVDDFEALAHWLIGVDQRRPFRVTTLTAPTRLVIDVEA